MSEVRMPRLADGMEQGTIVKWLVGDGSVVEAGAELLEIETDKATITHAAEFAGTVTILTQEGETVPVGAPIARIGDGDGAASPSAPAGPTAGASGSSAVADGAGSSVADGPHRPLATPLARRIAAAHALDLERVAGSGPRGRITKGDVLAAVTTPEEPRLAPVREDTAEPRSPVRASPGTRTVRPTRLQAVAAQRMTAAAAVPQFQVETEVVFDAALAWRAELKAVATVAPTVTDLIVRACALTLPEHPLVNGAFADGAFELHDHVHAGVAVAVDEGLVVVTVRDAHVKSLGTIAAESRALAEKARAGTATADELWGATFTVSNLGMFGMTAITPVVNPPQAAILGVGATRTSLARAHGELVERRLLTLRMTCDHRILDGATAARFLADVKDRLERPLLLAL